LRVCVSEFVPENDRVASQPVISTDQQSQSSIFTRRYPAPVAMKSLDMEHLGETLRRHAESVATVLRDGSSSQKLNTISKRLLGVIGRYYTSESRHLNRALLDKAMMLYAMHYFMGTRITYTPTSATDVLQALKKPMARTWEAKTISGPLNRQLKCVMNTLLHGLTRKVFEDLEKELRTRSTTVWATCFCTICILCFCIEEVQIQTNGFVMHKRQHDPDGSPPSEEAIVICRKLDDLPYAYMIELFHGVFKSRKWPMAYRQNHIFNPIRDGLDMDPAKGVDQETVDLAEEVTQIIKDCSEDLKVKSNTAPLFKSGYDSLDAHMLFREENAGRLAAKFVLSFQGE